VYTATGNKFTVNLGKISGSDLKAYWYNPRNGSSTSLGTVRNSGTREFTPQFVGLGSDWVLVLDDASKGYAAPGRPPSQSPVTETAQIDLVQGWNLISLPLNPLQTDVPAIIRGLESAVEAIYSYEDDRYLSFTTSGENSLTDLFPGRGYWVYMNSNATLTLTGTLAQPSISLLPGWNLAGFNSQKSMDTDRALASVAGKVIVYGYDSNSYRSYGVGTANDLKAFEPGKGYWIFATENLTWTIS
jgi:hypothetical protein